MQSKTVRLLVEVGVNDGISTYETTAVRDFVHSILGQYYKPDVKVSIVPAQIIYPEENAVVMRWNDCTMGFNCPVCANLLVADSESGTEGECEQCHAVHYHLNDRLVVEVNGTKALDYRTKSEDTNTASDPE
jgi:hypothetical protein